MNKNYIATYEYDMYRGYKLTVRDTFDGDLHDISIFVDKNGQEVYSDSYISEELLGPREHYEQALNWFYSFVEAREARS